MTARVAVLVSKNFSQAGPALVVDGQRIDLIADEYGTPLYVYSAATLDRAWRRLRDTLPATFTIYYSVKANPNPAIMSFFVARGCGLEIASAGELHLALQLRSHPTSIIFAGPGKQEAELELAVKAGVREIHVESPTEIRRLAAIGHRLGVTVPVGIRVNPGPAALGGAMRMGGKPGPFGIDEEQLDDAVDRLIAEPHLDFRGLHLFVGTQILNADVLLAQYRTGLQIAQRCARRLGRPLPTLDFGGGFGIPYFSGETELDLHALREGLGDLMARVQADRFLASTSFFVEPGRFLVGEAGVYVTRIVDVKTSRGRTFVVLDGGMNHHLAASGNLGQIIKRNFPVALLNRLNEPASESVDVVGPLCTPLDVLARDVVLPPPVVGDLVGVFQSGAYARTASPLGFLSYPGPPEVLVTAGRPKLIRRRGGDDLVADLVMTGQSSPSRRTDRW